MSNDEPDVPADGQAQSESGGDAPDGDGVCFVIAPIGDSRTETRRQTDGLLKEAIRPVVEERVGLDVTAAHQMPEAGSITRQVIQRLLEAELVVADLTGLNANVMYELAVRHAKGRPVVPIAQEGTSLPFDITTERTVFYEDSMHGLSELKPKLEEAARAALQDEEPDNPIYRAQQDFQMREASGETEFEDHVLDRLESLESAVRKQSREGPSIATGTTADADANDPLGAAISKPSDIKVSGDAV
jgi:nucleoside 2-deoxyribosyltransferase